MDESNAILLKNFPLLVGSALDLATVRAQHLDTYPGDILELRLDALWNEVDALHTLLEEQSASLPPLLLTARAPEEGGQNELSWQNREVLLSRFLPWASAVDLELALAPKASELIATIQDSPAHLILSQHHFSATPPLEQLTQAYHLASECGADIAKFAFATHTLADISTMENLLQSNRALPLAAMGMGPLGKVSRLLAAQWGSALIYGHLGTSAASGQWPLALLKEVIHEIA